MKTVLITGGTRGIGRAAAICFYEAGYRVALTYHTQEDAAKALALRYPDLYTVRADLSVPQNAERAVQDVLSVFGKIDVLINNAAEALPQMLFTDTTYSDWQRLFCVDLFSMMAASRAVIPSMVAQKDGVILNLSSMWGVTGGSCEVVYSAAKAGVLGFTKALAKELGPSDIRVNAVAPGVIDTDMNGHLSDDDKKALCEQTPLERLGTPEEVAKTLLFLASDAGSFYTGQVFSPNGGMVI